jgi:hypothetical protein
MSKNEDRERARNARDNNSVSVDEKMFVTYEMIEYGFTSADNEMEK